MTFGRRLFVKYAIISCAGMSGYLFHSNQKPIAMASCEKATWDTNWDRRKPANQKEKPKATRHLILVRHGQCDYRNSIDTDCALTPLGREQAASTAKRLVELKVPVDKWIFSTMQRAQETGNILLAAQSSVTAPVEHCPMIAEGIPCEPSPYDYWNEDGFTIWQDNARLEAAFRKHFYRADRDEDTYTVLVCHANVIRYFICRALQLPPEAWLRFTLYHGSVTLLSIRPSGRVTLRKFGEIGHMPPDLVTYMNAR